MQEPPTEVAFAKIEATKEKIPLLQFCNQETLTMQAEHSIDRFEQTLSGKWLILHLKEDILELETKGAIFQKGQNKTEKEQR